MDVHEVAVATRNELTRRGWAQGSWVANDGRVCLFAAYLCALQREVNYESTRAVSLTDKGAHELARALGFSSVRDTILWQDETGRSVSDILSRFDEAIATTAPAPANPLIGLPEYAELGLDVSESEREMAFSF